MNKLRGRLESFEEQGGILRLFVRLDSVASPQGFQPIRETEQNAESNIRVLLLENANFAQNLFEKSLKLCFKESNIIVATAINGTQNTFKAEILRIQSDKLFARIFLKSSFCEEISALCPLEFIEQNALKIGDLVDWHIPESEIMVVLSN